MRIGGLLLVSGMAALCLAGAALAGTPQEPRPATEGLAGCASDVPVAAIRSRITFTSDGRDVPALLYEPRGATPAGSALVILHGSSLEEDLNALDNHAIQLASRGFAVIVPFYLRAERGDDPARARAAHRVWRQVALDAADAIAVEMGLAPGKVLLWGQTRGGGVALAATLEPGSPVGGAVAVNIGGQPQDDAEGRGRPFLLIRSATLSGQVSDQVRRMGDRIEERGGRVDRLEVAGDHDRLEGADWCRIMDATRGLLERVAASGAGAPAT